VWKIEIAELVNPKGVLSFLASVPEEYKAKVFDEARICLCFKDNSGRVINERKRELRKQLILQLVNTNVPEEDVTVFQSDLYGFSLGLATEEKFKDTVESDRSNGEEESYCNYRTGTWINAVYYHRDKEEEYNRALYQFIVKYTNSSDDRIRENARKNAFLTGAAFLTGVEREELIHMAKLYLKKDKANNKLDSWSFVVSVSRPHLSVKERRELSAKRLIGM
jgi:hypothetical protein